MFDVTFLRDGQLMRCSVEGVRQLWTRLRRDQPELLGHFEEFVQRVINELKRTHSDCKSLETALKRYEMVSGNGCTLSCIMRLATIWTLPLQFFAIALTHTIKIRPINLTRTS
jgi:hypothetical protein